MLAATRQTINQSKEFNHRQLRSEIRPQNPALTCVPPSIWAASHLTLGRGGGEELGKEGRGWGGVGEGRGGVGKGKEGLGREERGWRGRRSPTNKECRSGEGPPVVVLLLVL